MLKGIKTIATYPAEEILSNISKKAIFEVEINNKKYTSKLNSLRLRTFQKSIRCICCGRKGTEMGLDLPSHTDKPHFNLYCIEGKKKILMTKDHIIPKSKGGRNHISNMQTMCCHCNTKKGDKNPEEYTKYLEKRTRSKQKKRK